MLTKMDTKACTVSFHIFTCFVSCPQTLADSADRRQKGGFVKGWFWRMCPHSGFWYRGTSECTLVPAFATEEHPPKQPFWKPPFCEPLRFCRSFGGKFAGPEKLGLAPKVLQNLSSTGILLCETFCRTFLQNPPPKVRQNSGEPLGGRTRLLRTGCFSSKTQLS